jgi:hypothetical protein
MWWAVAAIANFQIWTAFHHGPKTVTGFFVPASGINSHAVTYRSTTRHIVACDSMEHGMHPGEASCFKAAWQAILRGSSHLFKTLIVVNLLRTLAGRSKKNRSILGIGYALFISFISITIQLQINRSAYCIQSKCFPNTFQPWLGALIGFISSNFALLDDEEMLVHQLLFTASNSLLTFLLSSGLKSNHINAIVFSLGVTMQQKNGRFKEIFSS